MRSGLVTRERRVHVPGGKGKPSAALKKEETFPDYQEEETTAKLKMCCMNDADSIRTQRFPDGLDFLALGKEDELGKDWLDDVMTSHSPGVTSSPSGHLAMLETALIATGSIQQAGSRDAVRHLTMARTALPPTRNRQVPM